MKEVIKEINSGIKSGDFNKCGDNMTLLKNVSEQLKDHLSFEKEYEKVKNEIIDHLKNTIDMVLVPILNSNIKNEDLEKLRYVHCIYTSSNKSLSLRSHLSNNEIDKYYQIYSEKILNAALFCKKMVEDVFKNKTKDESFKESKYYIDRLELLSQVDKFDSLNISNYLGQSIDVIISHVSTVRNEAVTLIEKIEGKANLLKDVLKVVKILIFSEWTKKYSNGRFEELIDSIRNTLEYYFEGIFYDFSSIIFDIEQDNKNLIEKVIKIESEINCNHVDELIRLLSKGSEKKMKEYHKEIMKEFNSKFDKVYFKAVKFLQKVDEKKYLFSNFEMINNIIKFSNLVKNLRRKLTSENKDKCTEGINSFVHKYKDFVSNIIRISLKNLLKDEEINEKDSKEKGEKSAYENSENIRKNMNNLLEIKNNFNLLYKELNIKLEDIYSSFESVYTSVLESINICEYKEDHNELEKNLKIVRNLIVLDQYFDQKNKFSELYSKYQEKLGRISELKDLTEKISNQKFTSLLELDQMQHNKSEEKVYKQLKELFNQEIFKFLNSTKYEIVTLDFSNEFLSKNISDFRQIFEKLELIFSIKLHLTEETNKIINDFKQIVTENFDDKIKRFLKKIENDYESTNNTMAGFESINRIKLTIQVIKKYVSYKKIEDEISKLEEKLNQATNQLLKQFKERPICNYMINPPKIEIEKLKKLNNNRTASQIEEIILEKIEKRVLELKTHSSKNIEHTKYELDLLKKIISSSLPENLKNAITPILDRALGLINAEENRKETDLKRYIELGDINPFKKEYDLIKDENYKNKVYREIYLPGVEVFTQKFKDAISKCSIPNIQKFTSSDTIDINRLAVEVSDLYGKLMTIKEVSGKSEIIKIIESVEKSARDWISSLIEKVNNILDKNFSLNEGYLNTSLICYTILLQFLMDTRKVKILTKEHSNKIEKTAESIIQNCAEHFNAIKLSLKKGEVNRVKTCMEKILSLYKLYEIQQKKIMISDKKIPNTFEEVKSEFEKEIKDWTLYLENIDLLDPKIIKNEKLLENHYREIQNKVKLIDSFKGDKYINDSICKNITDDFKEKFKTSTAELYSKVEKLTKDEKIEKNQFFLIKDIQTTLKYFEKYLTPILNIPSGIKEISDLFQNKIESVSKELEKFDFNENLDSITSSLVKIQEVSDYLPDLKQFAQKKLTNYLSSLKKKQENCQKRIQYLPKLYSTLIKDNTSKGISQTVASHPLFKGSQVDIQFHRHGYEYILENDENGEPRIKSEGVSLDMSELKSLYLKFEKENKDLYEAYLLEGKNVDYSKLYSNVRSIAQRHKSTKPQWTRKVESDIPTLLANIFSIWTLKNSDVYFENIDSKDRSKYLFVPHAAQIFAILRMLGMGEKEPKGFGGFSYQNPATLKNSLIEILTGQGKSVILAVTSTILALLGFDVYCACYSSYLSTRDFNDFKFLFDGLDITEKINYGTFNELCEKFLNKGGNVRKMVEDMILGRSIQKGSKDNKVGGSILLIDEVDVFFNEDFFGKLYSPGATISHPKISDLIRGVWDLKLKGCNFRKEDYDKFINSKVYLDCCNEFKGWEFIISEALKDMFSDIKVYESHDYFVSEEKNQICYKDLDTHVSNLRFRYKTTFAYFHENSNGKISNDSLERNLSIVVNCGTFSYAEIPHKFEFIMGVSGTLKDLSKAEKDVIENVYKIKRYTFMPSVYGKNNLKFYPNKDIIIEESSDHHLTISKEIKDNLKGKDGDRAVLVFFDNYSNLLDFYNSKQFATMKNDSLIMVEGQSKDTIISNINLATRSSQVTLLTSSFGRGTDFISRDSCVIKNGGVHVIQTFLSESPSEETQIKGRTARQSQNGTYQLILSKLALQKFQITENELKGLSNIQEFLNKKRNETFSLKYLNNKKHVDFAKIEHDQAQKFILSILDGDSKYVNTYLRQRNIGSTLTTISRIICLMDATGSMTHLLNNAKNTVSVMFSRAKQILIENKRDPNSFELMFAVYRNYNVKAPKLFVSSQWQSDPTKLVEFMQNIYPDGGIGPEAIEIGLHHSYNEIKKYKINQIILIGDAPCNPDNQIKSYRNYLGESYWSTTYYKEPTYLKTELDNIISSGVPINSFWVDKYAKENFDYISKSTGGNSTYLAVNSNEGSKLLTDTVTKEILKSIDPILSKKYDEKSWV